MDLMRSDRMDFSALSHCFRQMPHPAPLKRAQHYLLHRQSRNTGEILTGPGRDEKARTAMLPTKTARQPNVVTTQKTREILAELRGHHGPPRR
jgi:hypothetical protein